MCNLQTQYYWMNSALLCLRSTMQQLARRITEGCIGRICRGTPNSPVVRGAAQRLRGHLCKINMGNAMLLEQADHITVPVSFSSFPKPLLSHVSHSISYTLSPILLLVSELVPFSFSTPIPTSPQLPFLYLTLIFTGWNEACTPS